jgi:ribosomal peptide maturation radical SAM protein 1
VLLCSMPFGLVVGPSLALGLLQASLRPLRLRTRQLYPSIWFTKTIGYDAYMLLAMRWEVSDWVFARAVFPDTDLDDGRFIEEVLKCPPPEYQPSLSALPEGERVRWIDAGTNAALRARRYVPEFLDRCAALIEAQRPRLVGFSCFSRQRFASLALARRIKQQVPGTFVLFGGPEIRGIAGLELLRQFGYVDAVVSGPGDVVFPEIVQRVLDGRSLDGLCGVWARQPALPPATALGDAPAPAHLDDLPYPEVDDFFAERERSGMALGLPAVLTLETSRGCWWGHRMSRRCTFCGLNAGCGYAAKSPLRAVEEIASFAGRHPGMPINMTDTVLDPRSFQGTLRALRERQLGLRIRYDVRPTLTRAELRALVDAGVILLEAGIESLSSPVLAMMRKGTTMLQNVQFLRFAKEARARLAWGILGGLPAEPPEAYAEMERLIPLLTHLPPPKGFQYIIVVRDSPLFEERAGDSSDPVPLAAYSYLLPFEPAVVRNLAVFFRDPARSWDEIRAYTVGVQEAVNMWRHVHLDSHLVFTDDGLATVVLDRRPIATARRHLLHGLDRFVHLCCGSIRSTSLIHRRACTHGFPKVKGADVERSLRTLEGIGLVVAESDRWLRLTVRSKRRGLAQAGAALT